MSVAAHVDESTKEKIKIGQYVDFARLVPKDRVLAEDNNCVQLVMKGGGTYFVLASESTTLINSVSRWDQAFRVFSDIYCKFNPNRSSELVQYSHVIHTAAVMFVWDNVYAYDRDFRLHIAANPRRSWAIILQQAWAMRLKDQICFNSSENGRHRGGNHRGYHGHKDIYKRFNRGRCTFGAHCKFDHRCSYCFKPGHGIHNCRKFAAYNKRDQDDKDGSNSKSNNNSNHPN